MIATRKTILEAIQTLRESRYPGGMLQTYEEWSKQRRENIETLEDLLIFKA